MTPPVVSVQKSINRFKFEPVIYDDEYIKEDDSIRVLGKFTHDADDEVFIERTNAAMDRVENDDEEWLSVDDFLKELDLTEGRATGIPTIQKKLRENGSPKATIETDESRSYFLIDIPARKDFVQDAEIVKEPDTERIKLNMSKMCPRYVQDMSMNELGLLAVCLLRAQEGISAQEMLDNIDKVSFKQKKRKYLNKLLEMGAILMTIPDKPTSKNQKYILSDIGYEIVHKQ